MGTQLINMPTVEKYLVKSHHFQLLWQRVELEHDTRLYEGCILLEDENKNKKICSRVDHTGSAVLRNA